MDDIKHRRALRLRNYDYSQSGAYFVTLCTQNRMCLFGNAIDGCMRINEWGRLAHTPWLWLATQYRYVLLDEFVVMPNHLHGILIIDPDGGSKRQGMIYPYAARLDTEGRSRAPPTMIPTKVKPLGGLIGAFKTVSTKSINTHHGTPQVDVWQRYYYEHVIRDEADLSRIREYIANNPEQWELDEENPRRAT